jgi:hypothetical protein
MRGLYVRWKSISCAAHVSVGKSTSCAAHVCTGRLLRRIQSLRSSRVARPLVHSSLAHPSQISTGFSHGLQLA